MTSNNSFWYNKWNGSLKYHHFLYITYKWFQHYKVELGWSQGYMSLTNLQVWVNYGYHNICWKHNLSLNYSPKQGTQHSVNFQTGPCRNFVYTPYVVRHCWCLSHLKKHKQQSSALSQPDQYGAFSLNIIYRQPFFDRFPTDWATITLLTTRAEIPFVTNTVKLTVRVKASRRWTKGKVNITCKECDAYTEEEPYQWVHQSILYKESSPVMTQI